MLTVRIPLNRSLIVVLFSVLTLQLHVWAKDSAEANTKYAPFEFALIGDIPYGVAPGVNFPLFDSLVDEINNDTNVQWVVHVGDIKSGGTDCSDAVLKDRYERFSKFNKPFILTPGDNEWTDCHRAVAGSYKPLERLNKIREIFYSNPSKSMGKNKLVVSPQSQSGKFQNYPENVIWKHNGVTFATIHMVGSQNGLKGFDTLSKVTREKEDDKEVQERIDAAINWLDEVFARSEESIGVFIAIHANPGLERKRDKKARNGYKSFIKRFEHHVKTFNGPIVLAHGDSHYFRIDKPRLNTAAYYQNFTRVETYAAPNYDWIRVIVDPASKSVFRFVEEWTQK